MSSCRATNANAARAAARAAYAAAAVHAAAAARAADSILRLAADDLRAACAITEVTL